MVNILACTLLLACVTTTLAMPVHEGSHSKTSPSRRGKAIASDFKQTIKEGGSTSAKTQPQYPIEGHAPVKMEGFTPVKAEPLSAEAGQGSSLPATSRAPQFPFVQGIKHHKPFKFAITNVETGMREEYDPAKHFFDPYAHHPTIAREVQDKFLEGAKATNMEEFELHRNYRSLDAIFKGSKHITKDWGAVVDHDGKYIYHRQGMPSKEALDKMNEGSAKTLIKHENGEISLPISRSEHERMDWNWATMAQMDEIMAKATSSSGRPLHRRSKHGWTLIDNRSDISKPSSEVSSRSARLRQLRKVDKPRANDRKASMITPSRSPAHNSGSSSDNMGLDHFRSTR